MKPLYKLIAVLILANLMYTMKANAQTVDDTTTFVIFLNDGGEIMGRILSYDEWAYRVATLNQGIILVPRYAVKEKLIASERELKAVAVISPNPHPTRYFYSPTAVPLKKGEGYIQTIYFVSAQIQYGFTDHLSAGIATTALGAPLFVSMKYGSKVSEKMSLAVGLQAGNLSWINTGLSLGVGFGTLTMGSEEKSISLSAGYGMMREKYQNYNYYPVYSKTDTVTYQNSGMFSISGITRISKKASLIGEFWYVSSANAFFGGPGIRVYPGRKVCWDFIMSTVISPDLDFFVIPGISATWKI